jgi:hypothetical protein
MYCCLFLIEKLVEWVNGHSSIIVCQDIEIDSALFGLIESSVRRESHHMVALVCQITGRKRRVLAPAIPYFFEIWVGLGRTRTIFVAHMAPVTIFICTGFTVSPRTIGSESWLPSISDDTPSGEFGGLPDVVVGYLPVIP